jgi:NAD(P)-dependent dehydrogenase (short-subunit alcohol dehydrogenase family)
MKTLIITGGTGGLGTAVVARLERDYRCVLLRHKDVDLEDATSVRNALEKIDPPYGLVHLAGGYADGSVSKTDDDTWRKMMGLNLTASFNIVRETLARMHRDQPGRIIAISSDATRTKFASAAAYTISKTGLNTLIELTAAELAGTDITANALLPTALATPAMLKFMPAGKLVPLERVAESIAFLLSDAAASINGALIPLQP